MRRVFIAESFANTQKDHVELVDEAVRTAGGLPVRLISYIASDTSVPEAIGKGVADADLVICDVTYSTPNVMFCLGTAFTSKKPVLLLASHVADVDTVVAGRRVLRYATHSEMGKATLVNDLTDAIKDVFAGVVEDTANLTGAAKLSVFIGYSHRDNSFLERALVHLRPLERMGLIDQWSDKRLAAGDDWRAQIRSAVDACTVAVILVSADFLASEFVVTNELPPLLTKAFDAGRRVVPVVVKPCRYLREPSLAKLQAINDPARPLILVSEGEQEKVWDDVARIVEDHVRS